MLEQGLPDKIKNIHWNLNFIALFFKIFIVFLKFLLLFNYSWMPFSPSLHPTPAEPTTIPDLHHPPWFCPCVLYSSACNPLSSLSPPHSPLTIVRFFLTSMCGCFFLPCPPTYWYDPLLNRACFWFLLLCSSVQKLYSSFPLGPCW